MIFFLLAGILTFVFFGSLILGFLMDEIFVEKEEKTSEMSGFILDPNSVSKGKEENLNIEEI